MFVIFLPSDFQYDTEMKGIINVYSQINSFKVFQSISHYFIFFLSFNYDLTLLDTEDKPLSLLELLMSYIYVYIITENDSKISVYRLGNNPTLSIYFLFH